MISTGKEKKQRSCKNHLAVKMHCNNQRSFDREKWSLQVQIGQKYVQILMNLPWTTLMNESGVAAIDEGIPPHAWSMALKNVVGAQPEKQRHVSTYGTLWPKANDKTERAGTVLALHYTPRPIAVGRAHIHTLIHVHPSISPRILPLSFRRPDMKNPAGTSLATCMPTNPIWRAHLSRLQVSRCLFF